MNDISRNFILVGIALGILALSVSATRAVRDLDSIAASLAIIASPVKP